MEKLKLKNIIKSLGMAQKQLKKDRKTGPYEIIRYSDYHYVDWSKMPERIKKANGAATQVQSNKITITAALNLYHEIRGSSYRHFVPECKQYSYKKEYERLQQSLTDTKVTI